MKDYYKILGVSPSATAEEITYFDEYEFKKLFKEKNYEYCAELIDEIFQSYPNTLFKAELTYYKIKVFDIYTGRKVKENIYRLYLKKNLEDIDIIIPENILTFQERYPSYFKGIDIPDPFIPFLGNILLSEILPHFGGFLIHAACVEYRDGHACIFVGPSRAGKTTLAKLWQNRGFEILGDDIVGIRRGEEGNFYAYPVPWGDSLSNRRMNRRVKLNKIFFISKSKDKRNKIEFISQKEAMNEMIRGSLLPYWDRKLTIIELHLIHQILDIIPSFRLFFYPADSLLSLLKKFK